MPILLVFLGGGLGAVCRYLGGVAYGRLFGLKYPFIATGVINVVGGLLMGLLVGALALYAGTGQERWRLLLGVGVLGGFTTFSTFSLEAYMLIQRHAYALAAGYILGSVVLSIGALIIGLQVFQGRTP
jgi:CrcB protein